MDGQNILVNGSDDGTLVYLRWRYVQDVVSNLTWYGVLKSRFYYLDIARPT